MNLDCGPCRVRDWRLSDKPSLLRLADNPRVACNLSHRFPHPYTEADADSWFVLLASTTPPTNWALEVGGDAVGGIGIDVGVGIYARSARFGYWLGEPYWGRGLMSAAARAVADYVLDHFGLVRLEAPVFEGNLASMRILEKSGFTREGTLRRSVFKNGKILDAVLFARVR